MGDFTRVNHLMEIDEDLFLHRPQHFSRNPEPLVWECPTCGIIWPKQLANGFMRRQCACMRQAREDEERKQQAQTVAEQRKQARTSKTYTWLGPDFSETGLEQQTFANFVTSLQPDVQHFQAVYQTAQAFAQSIQADPHFNRNILFHGSWGTGKTHLASAILNELREHEIPCLFTTAQGFFDALYHQFNQKQPTAHLIAQAADARVLVIDDLDKLYLPATTDGSFQKRTLFDVLDKRYKRRLSTIITMNEIDPTPYVGEAIASRLMAGLILLHMDGVDQRTKMHAPDDEEKREEFRL